ncbi:MAG: energy-coupled thiamine transporter ThiT, partial [Ruminiclostridium sp.]|nr:energy-coupled thiamine transporter ThiT [Ruminiclostridium sp.]
MEKTKKVTNVGKLVTSAILLALAMVLSLIKVYKLPLCGSVTLLSMLPVCIISLKYGVKWGFLCSFLYAFIQLGT